MSKDNKKKTMPKKKGFYTDGNSRNNNPKKEERVSKPLTYKLPQDKLEEMRKLLEKE